MLFSSTSSYLDSSEIVHADMQKPSLGILGGTFEEMDSLNLHTGARARAGLWQRKLPNTKKKKKNQHTMILAAAG